MDKIGIDEAERRAIIECCDSEKNRHRLQAILTGDNGHHFPSCLEDAKLKQDRGVRYTH